MPKVYTLDMLENINEVEELESTETDEEIIERLRKRFQILEDMTKAIKKGAIRSMIVRGPPGVGKSFGVSKVLEKSDFFTDFDDKPKTFEIIKGDISPIGLYMKLYEYSNKNCVLVFDDCDRVLLDDDKMALIKGALDTTDKRILSWNKESRGLKDNGIPNRFEYKGGCIFITNYTFGKVKSQRLQDDLAALNSRCHYLDLKVNTTRERMLRIKQIVNDGMLDQFNFTDEEKNEVINFIDEHKKQLGDISLRVVLKVAQLKDAMPSTWQEVALMTCSGW